MEEENMPSMDAAVQHLFEVSGEALAAERALAARGTLPERWKLLKEYETARLSHELNIALMERAATDVQIELRSFFVWQKLHNRLPMSQIPGSEDFYHLTHRDWYGTLRPIVDLEAAGRMLSNLDPRMPFPMRKSHVVWQWLKAGIRQSTEGLPDPLPFKPETNNVPPLSPQQFDAVVAFIANCGIPLKMHDTD